MDIQCECGFMRELPTNFDALDALPWVRYADVKDETFVRVELDSTVGEVVAWLYIGNFGMYRVGFASQQEFMLIHPLASVTRH